jgi:nitroimidazol reductase NimA-like FMN-containing flavoprotein (pyridoxamine 5'-phosphate oxidase superfamily)
MTDDVRAMVHDVVDANRYLTLGTTEADGRPRLTPVYYTHHDYRVFYWVSSPEARHSGNLASRPDVSIVIFDSTVPPGQTQAVYLDATAGEVPPEELADGCARAFAQVRDGARAFEPSELTEPADLRLYRATATAYGVHIRGSHPTYGRGVDHRMPVDMTDA